MHLLVVIDFKRLQELEVKGEAPLHPDAVVAAQVSGVGPGVLQAGDVARRLCVQRAAALGCGVRARGSPGSPGVEQAPAQSLSGSLPCPSQFTMAGTPIRLKLIAWVAGAEEATNVVVT